MLGIVTAGLLLVAGGNAHLLWVAIRSAPGCVASVTTADGGEVYRAARDAC